MSEVAPRGVRWTIRFLAFLLAILLMTFFDFVLGDIDDMKGPRLNDYLQVAPQLQERHLELQLRVKTAESSVVREREIQKNLQVSLENAQSTMDQMSEIHRLRLEKSQQPTEREIGALTQAQERFLKTQESFESANAKIGTLEADLHRFRADKNSVQETIRELEKPGRESYQDAYEAFRYRTAVWKLAFIVPVFLSGSWVLARRKGSPYRPLCLAWIGAAFLQLGMVMHEHFPKDYFKYIAIAASVSIVGWFLLRLIRNVSTPSRDALHRRRREAYHGSMCPDCGYPFPESHGATSSCSSCGVELFGPCNACGESRHRLLPFCLHCGAQTAA